jgi:hypothetical protein
MAEPIGEIHLWRDHARGDESGIWLDSPSAIRVLTFDSMRESDLDDRLVVEKSRKFMKRLNSDDFSECC